jgi:hypothetical protein
MHEILYLTPGSYTLTLRIEAVYSFEKSMKYNRIARCYISEGNVVQIKYFSTS